MYREAREIAAQGAAAIHSVVGLKTGDAIVLWAIHYDLLSLAGLASLGTGVTVV